MSETDSVQSYPSLQVVAHSDSQPSPPSWLTEAILIAQHWRATGLLKKLQESVQVARGRAGTYEGCDFVLLLLAYAVSGERSLKEFRERLTPYLAPLASLWDRSSLPSLSALSRFLGDVGPEDVETLRRLLCQDLLSEGIGPQQMGGLLDRQGQRHLLFDGDATVEAVRERAVVSGEEWPPAQRRRARACAPGYSGRKRGEKVRSRLVVQQAHTQEWLGSWGGAGNPDLWGTLRKGCQQVVEYLKSRGVAPSQGLLRLDGAYGHAKGAFIVAREFSLGYLMRCADYRLLEHPQVKASLAQAQPQRFQQLDSGVVRQVYDIGFLEWRAGGDPTLWVNPRLIVTCAEAPRKGKPKVGVVREGKAYELFTSDQVPEALTAIDLLSLYLARGGFEGTLAQEDREGDPDRWCSNHPQGQELWQLLAQQVWNVRLRLGLVAAPQECRHTLWAEALEAEERVVEAPLSPPGESGG